MYSKSKPILDKVALHFLKIAAETPKVPLDQLSAQDVRNNTKLLSQKYGSGPEIGTIENQTISHASGSFDIRILHPKEQPDLLIVYYHGGGWVIGDIDNYLSFSKYLVQKSNAVVVMVNYRKAPEHPFPAAIDDAYEALLWADNYNHSSFNHSLPLVVAGDSAGGNLAAIVAQLAKEKNGPTIKVQGLVYPVTNSDLNTASYQNPDNQLFLTKESMIWFWNQYQSDVDKRSNPLLSPLQADDLQGLPPTVLLTAQFDPLNTEGAQYAQALINKGVSVIYKNYEDQFHNFFAMVDLMPRALPAMDFFIASIRLLLNEK